MSQASYIENIRFVDDRARAQVVGWGTPHHRLRDYHKPVIVARVKISYLVTKNANKQEDKTMIYNMMQKLQPAKKTTSIVASVVAGAGLALTAATLPAEAWQFNFSGSDAGGTGSATMNFDGLGTENVTVLLDNTSPSPWTAELV